MKNSFYTPYSILGVNEDANLDTIKKAYHKLARLYHPDRNLHCNLQDKIQTEHKFKEISEAYTVLIDCNGKYGINKFSKFVNITNLFKTNNGFKNIFTGFNFDNITNNLMREMILFNRYINQTKSNMKYTESLNINVSVELFDIYHNLEKTIYIKRYRLCELCLGIGYNLEKTFKKCDNCGGLKTISKDIPLTFNCKFKNIVFPNKSHEDNINITGNIYVNIIPKTLREYKIINNYDLLYIKTIEENELENNNYNFELKHFDNELYNFNINNLIFNKEYLIQEMGLYNINNNKRNSLIIIFVKKYDITNYNTFIKKTKL
jgi:DnaJ-class molecular chaperone